MAPAIPDKIPCQSSTHLREELSLFSQTVSLPETEDSWEKISRALQKLTAVVKGGAYRYPQELVAGVKAMSRPINSAMNSERTRLSGSAVDLLTEMSPRLDGHFEPLMPLFANTVVKLCGRTNKLYITRARGFLEALTKHTSLTGIIPYLQEACDDKSTTMRVAGTDYILLALKRFNPALLAKFATHVEMTIKSTGRDKDAGVRSTSRKVFEAYKLLWPERVDAFTAPLTPVMRKYLEITSRAVSRPPEPLKTVRSQDPLSASVPNSHASASTHHRRSLSADAAETRMTQRLMTSNVDRDADRPPNIVPVRRARSQKPPMEKTREERKEQHADPLPHTNGHAPLSRTRSVASIRPIPPNGDEDNDVHKRPIRMRQPSPPPAPKRLPPSLARSGPSRPNAVGVTTSTSNVVSGRSSPRPFTFKSAGAEIESRVVSPEGSTTSSGHAGGGGGERRGCGAQRVLLPQKPVDKSQLPAQTEISRKPVRLAPAPVKEVEKPSVVEPVATATIVPPPPRGGKLAASLQKKASVAQLANKPKPNVIKNPPANQPAPAVAATVSLTATTTTAPIKATKPSFKPVPGNGSTATSTKKPITAAAGSAPRRDLTAPTRAQLARAKALETEREQVAVKKPSSNAAGNRGKGFVPTRGRGRIPAPTARFGSVPPRSHTPLPEAKVPLPKSRCTTPMPEEDGEIGMTQPVEKEIKDLALPSAEERVPNATAPMQASTQCQQSEEIMVIKEEEALIDFESGIAVESQEPIKARTGDPKAAAIGTAPESEAPVESQSPAELTAPAGLVPATKERAAKQEIEEGSDVVSPLKMVPTHVNPSKRRRDPFSGLPQLFMDALSSAPLPLPPASIHPTAFAHYETDTEGDRTIDAARIEDEDEEDEEDEMARLEFRVDGVDWLGRIVESPHKTGKAGIKELSSAQLTNSLQRETLGDLQFNQ